MENFTCIQRNVKILSIPFLNNNDHEWPQRYLYLHIPRTDEKYPVTPLLAPGGTQGALY